jgi:hypothetical protein
MEKNGGILFDRPKPTAGCSANGEENQTVALWAMTPGRHCQRFRVRKRNRAM